MVAAGVKAEAATGAGEATGAGGGGELVLLFVAGTAAGFVAVVGDGVAFFSSGAFSVGPDKARRKSWPNFFKSEF